MSEIHNLKNLKIAMIVALFLQAIFWYKTEPIKPNLGIIPDLPSQASVQALSFGDKQFYFRTLALRIQNAGDSFGRFTALKNYDYEKLYNWLKILDSLDWRSNLMPSLASYYFSQTQNPEDTYYIVKYLDENAANDPDKKWWWLFQATFIAHHILKDHDLALEMAYKLRDTNGENAPLWTKQMAAFIHANAGESCQAYAVINELLNEHDSGNRELSNEEMNFMQHFIKTRLNKLRRTKFDPRKC